MATHVFKQNIHILIDTLCLKSKSLFWKSTVMNENEMESAYVVFEMHTEVPPQTVTSKTTATSL